MLVTRTTPFNDVNIQSPMII